MPSILHIVDAGASLQAIERQLREAEDGTFFEVVSLAAATVNGRDANVAVLRPRRAYGLVTLVAVDGLGNLSRQEIDACARQERGARRLLSYGAVWVAGRRVNVAAYRG
jgi:hypothetical protein